MDTSDKLFVWIEDIGKKLIQENNKEAVDMLLRRNKEMLEKLCIEAASRGYTPIVARFTPWNIRSSIPIMETSAKYGHISLCEILATMPHKIDIMAMIGARWGQLDVVNMMLDKGCLELDRLARIACEAGQIEVVKLLIKRGYQNMKLIAVTAQRYGHLDIVSLVL